MSDIKQFDNKKKGKKVSKDIAKTIGGTMRLGLAELSRTMKGGASKKEVKKQESFFVLKKGNQILGSEDKRENEKIEKRKHTA